MNFSEDFNKHRGDFEQERYIDQIREIETFRDLLNNHFASLIPEGPTSSRELPESPFKKFEDYLKRYLSEIGVEEQPRDYTSFHYVQGSTPEYSKIKGFDLSGDLIRIKFKEFVITKYPELFESH